MASTARLTKKTGKENAPPRSKHLVEDDEEGFDSLSGVEDGPKKSLTKAPTSKGKPLSRRQEEGEEDVQRKLTTVSAERDRLRTQRDTFSRQFEELSKTRTTEVEGLFEKYKQKAEVAAKTQNDIIANQTALTEKLQARVQALEKALAASREAASLPPAGGPFEAPGKADPKEVKALKDELSKAKSESKGKDDKIAELQREYKAEVEHSRSLQASTRGPAAPAPTSAVSLTPEEAEKDAASLALYEDLTMLNIANVKIKPGRYGKETTFNCILAQDPKSLNFKLRCFTQVDRNEEKPKFVKMVHYTPELLEHESEAFVQGLDMFSSQFVVPRDQLGGFLSELRSKMDLDGE